MSKTLIKQTKDLLDQMPPKKLKLAQRFLLLLHTDALSESEWQKVYAGEVELASGKSVSWRDVARTL